MKLSIVYAFSFIMLLGLAGCAHYKARPLRVHSTTRQAAEKTISMSYKIFSTYDCKRYLDRNPIAKGYQPVQITITNTTDHQFSFTPKSLSLSCISAQEVAKAVHTNTVARTVGYGVAGIFIWPFIIPAIVDGIGSAEANEQLDLDFADKSLYGQLIQPHSTVTGLVFVACDDFDEQFTLTLTNQTDNKRYALSTMKSMVKI